MSILSKQNRSPSVSELLDQIKRLINQQFDYVLVRGEVSNFSRASSGHIYLSLSDNKALINGVIFRGDSLRIQNLESIKNGSEVEVVAELNLYEKRGQVQLVIKKIRLLGEGDLKADFERLKKNLYGEGLFDDSQKRDIPKYPQHIAVISAPGSAALEDFLNIHNRRSSACSITILPAIMQGNDSSRSIINGLERIKNYHASKKIDCIVICRGGGSFEDLHCFNDERLARYVADFPLPIISAIGHQTDYTILDFVSDLRAETPSAAAEVITEFEFQLNVKLDGLKIRLKNNIQTYYLNLEKRVESRNPKFLELILRRNVTVAKNYLNSIKVFRRPEVDLRIYEYRQRLDEIYHIIKNMMNDFSLSKKNRMEKCSNLLNALNPEKVLDRGYAIVKNENDDVVSSVKDANINTILNIKFKDGEIDAQIV